MTFTEPLIFQVFPGIERVLTKDKILVHFERKHKLFLIKYYVKFIGSLFEVFLHICYSMMYRPLTVTVQRVYSYEPKYNTDKKALQCFRHICRVTITKASGRKAEGSIA